ncbi:MAG: MCE family protein [Bacteroidales bacterium]|nr:MCE family protein [Bacteroidales bacterium]
MSKPTNKRAVIVGIFVTLGLIFLLTGILVIGDLHQTFIRKIKVVTLFDDVSGLQVGNNIWFSGVKIGSISSLEFYAQTKVKVVMKLEEKAQQYIRKDAFVKLSTDGLIGNKILIIYGGSARSPQVEEGDTLKVEKTFTSEDMINTLQENNKNFLAITNDFKLISAKLAKGEGTVGKLLNDNAVYTQLEATTLSLQQASDKAQKLISALTTFSEGLNQKGTLANELTTDTVVFNSLKMSVLQLQQISDTAGIFVNQLKKAASNPNTAIGVMMYDEESGARIKQTIKNLEAGSQKLDEDLKAAQSNFLLRGYFKQQEKDKKKEQK